ncbi:MAG: hypothetical protein ACQEP2_00785 [Actinomycetota bacterium]
MQVKRVKFKSGLVKSQAQVENLPVSTWKWKEIPKKLRDLLKKDKPWELSGSYGDPTVATPIEYEKITFIGRENSEIIEFWNLGAVFFTSENTEELRRIFRCLVRFKDIQK